MGVDAGSSMPTAAHHTIIHHFRNRSGLPTALFLSGLPTALFLSGLPTALLLSGLPTALLLSGLPTASAPAHFSGHPTALLCTEAVALPLLSGHPTARMVSARPRAHVGSVAVLPLQPNAIRDVATAAISLGGEGLRSAGWATGAALAEELAVRARLGPANHHHDHSPPSHPPPPAPHP